MNGEQELCDDSKQNFITQHSIISEHRLGLTNLPKSANARVISLICASWRSKRKPISASVIANSAFSCRIVSCFFDSLLD